MNRRHDYHSLAALLFCMFQPLFSGQLCLFPRVSTYGEVDCNCEGGLKTENYKSKNRKSIQVDTNPGQEVSNYLGLWPRLNKTITYNCRSCSSSFSFSSHLTAFTRSHSDSVSGDTTKVNL